MRRRGGAVAQNYRLTSDPRGFNRHPVLFHSPISWQVSPEDRIATWNFLTFDKNKNKVLDRPEWKGFRQLVSEHQLLRRCGKKLPRYCDANQDRSITITEWLDCLRPPPAGVSLAIARFVSLGQI